MMNVDGEDLIMTQLTHKLGDHLSTNTFHWAIYGRSYQELLGGFCARPTGTSSQCSVLELL